MTELIWDGKYDAAGRRVAPLRVSLPFQTVETINESAVERQQALDLFSTGRDPQWRNRLIWGDKKYVLPSLLEEFQGAVDLIYIDPPFNVGADFSYNANVPDYDNEDDEFITFAKLPSMIETKAYRDIWGFGLDSYLKWFFDSVTLLRDLLSSTGTIYIHLDNHIVHYAKCILDEVFGEANFINEIIWRRANNKVATRKVSVIHDTLLIYGRTDAYTFNQIYHEYREEYLTTKYMYKENGRPYQLQSMYGKGPGSPMKFGDRIITPPPGLHFRWTQEKIDEAMKQELIVFPRGGDGMPRFKDFLDTKKGIPLQTIWNDIPDVNSQAIERTNYPTQKPEKLIDRILKISSNENALILDCFCGSGTTPVVAEKLNRRWIACDLGRFAIHTTRKRLLGIKGVKPFVVQNLGKYERQAWQSSEFGPAAAQAAYRDFVLKLYHAQPVHGYTWLHGLRAGHMVHVGAVDAPVSAGDVVNIVSELKRSIGSGADAPQSNHVDILAWDFAFELNEVAQQQAALANVQLHFYRIPRDVMDKRAVEQGDIHFFELAALSVDAQAKGRKVTLALTDFVIPPDDVPQDVQKAVQHWSQWIDYWAVDWDNHSDTFHNMWQTYRTKKAPKLVTKTDHVYEHPGEYSVVVKVIDILGNDTTRTVRITVE